MKSKEFLRLFQEVKEGKLIRDFSVEVWSDGVYTNIGGDEWEKIEDN